MRILIICILLFLTGLLSATTIYEIQYTTVPGNGTYPSLLSGQSVSTSGIVTTTNYADGHGYILSMPEGGAWKGILVYENSHSPVVGDLVQITGLVYEYNGLTEIKNITSYQVINSGNAIPPAAQVTTAQACTEAYEGVLVQVQNVNVIDGLNTYNEWTVSDGSGVCLVDDTFIDPSLLGYTIAPGLQFSFLSGIGFYSYSAYRISPRSAFDIELGGQGVAINLPTLQQLVGTSFAIPVVTSTLTLEQAYTDFQFTMTYDPTAINYIGYSQITTLSSQGVVNVTNNSGTVNVNYTGNGILTGSGILVLLNFTAVLEGISPLVMTHFQYNDTAITGISEGQVTVFGIHPEIQDTLSVIQRPLPTLPSIVIPGEILSVECTAPTNTTNWDLHLIRGATDVPMNLIASNYQQNPPRWVLQAAIPNVPVFELYDLHVTASGSISDRTRHSVKVLPTRKTNYYFVQITDTHIPTPLFYPETGYDTDSTNLVDLREVIKDINIIRPEFVMITGDVVNSGEMEDYQNCHWYSKAKRLLGEMEVPCYIIAGNHDLGGWDATPPPAGTSRKDWWKFFGWAWLNNSSSSYLYHTQDYSFDYGPIHYIGMEAYDNYEDYLLNIYGAQSFTATQMQWLQNDLNVSQAQTTVLFHHYDFTSQLDLPQLGIDMALWGHIHSNSGSLTTTPYDLSTRNCGEGNRAYRVIRVNGTTLQPENTISAGSTGANIQISFTPNNEGNSASVSATIINNQSLAFPDTMVKFNMPHGSGDFTVQNGTLEQVDTTGDTYIAYVRVNLPASAAVTVSINAGTPNEDENQTPISSIQLTNAPNPFSDSTQMKLVNEKAVKATLKIYNIKGELIRVLFNGTLHPGTTDLMWDGKTDNGKITAAGIYFCKLMTPSNTITRKLVRIR